jgi:hypothetical protein
MTDDGERRREHRSAWSQLWWNIESLGCLQPRHMGVNSMKILNFWGLSPIVRSDEGTVWILGYALRCSYATIQLCVCKKIVKIDLN